MKLSYVIVYTMKNTVKYIVIIGLAFTAGFLANMSINISFDDILSNGVEQGAKEMWNSPSNAMDSGKEFMKKVW